MTLGVIIHQNARWILNHFSTEHPSTWDTVEPLYPYCKRLATYLFTHAHFHVFHHSSGNGLFVQRCAYCKISFRYFDDELLCVPNKRTKHVLANFALLCIFRIVNNLTFQSWSISTILPFDNSVRVNNENLLKIYRILFS